VSARGPNAPYPAPAEALGLPAAFLQAGMPGVISTLWTVNDLSTAFLLGKFYQLHRKQGMEPAQALARAQEWLRTATYKDLWELLRLPLALPELDSAQFAQQFARALKQLLGKSPQLSSMAIFLKQLSVLTKKNPDGKPYTEPYYWAGFLYSGM
ncbi:MAG: CHAT domain-containing protein, partial [Gammaproteobacteria bacterium]|nr:CHAT domain-containing protein [Gammaproteobacteria bacterium]